MTASAEKSGTIPEAEPIDWFALKIEFVTGGMKGTDFARFHSLPYLQVKEHMRQGKWVRMQKEFHERIDAKLADLLVESRSRAAIQSDGVRKGPF